MEKFAVLLLGYGAASSPEEAPDFVRNLVREISGREPPVQALKEAERKYREVGGSPYLRISEKQRNLLKSYLKEKFPEKKIIVKLAYRYGQPSFSSALNEVLTFKPDSLFFLSLSPFPSPYGSTGYFKKIKSLLEKANYKGKTFFIADWSEHPFFFQAWEEKIQKTLEEIPSHLISSTRLIFTFHSLPLKVARDFPEYQERARKISEKLSKKLKMEGEVAFQSGKDEGWLEPSLKAVIKRAAERGEKALLVVPLGTITDHLETLYDLDVEAKSLAAEAGLKFYRVSALNDSSLLIQALGETLSKNLKSKSPF